MLNTKRFSNDIIFILLMLMAPIGQVSIDFYATSLPVIAQDLHVSNELTRLIVTVYLISYGFGQILHGTLADFMGRKRLLLIALPLYGLSTIAVPFCSSIYPILIMRFIQGISISAVSVLVKAITTDIYKNERLTKAISLISISWGMSPILAPVLGSYVQTYFGWKGCFVFIALLTFIVFAGAVFIIHNTQEQKPAFKWQLFIDNHLYILKHVYFWRYVLQINVAIVCLLAFITQTPTLLQTTYHLTFVENGYIDLVASLMFLIGAQLSQKISAFEPRGFNIVTLQLLMIMLLSAVLLGLLYQHNTNLTFFMVCSSVMMCITGILFPESLAKCLQFFQAQAGIVSGLVGFITLVSPALLFVITTLLHIKQQFVFPGIMLALCLCTLIALNAIEKIRQPQYE